MKNFNKPNSVSIFILCYERKNKWEMQFNINANNDFYAVLLQTYISWLVLVMYVQLN